MGLPEAAKSIPSESTLMDHITLIKRPQPSANAGYGAQLEATPSLNDQTRVMSTLHILIPHLELVTDYGAVTY